MKRRTPAVCLAFSGGLDTTYCALLLREQGYRVHAVTVDTGGFSKAETRTIAARAKAAGVEKHVFFDGRRGRLRALRAAASLRQRAARRRLPAVGRGGARGPGREGRRATPAGSAPGRSRTARRPPATTSSASTPGLRVLAPGIEVLAPVRDGGVSREDETAYCESLGVTIPREDDPLLRQRRSLGHDDRRSGDARPVGAAAGVALPGPHPGEGAARFPHGGRSGSAPGARCRFRAGACRASISSRG